MYKVTQTAFHDGQFLIHLSNGRPIEDWQYQGSSLWELANAVVDVAQQEVVRSLGDRLKRMEAERLLMLIHMKRYFIARTQNQGSTPLSLRSFYELVNRMEISLSLARIDWVRHYEAAGGADVDKRWPEAEIGWLLMAPERAAQPVDSSSCWLPLEGEKNG